jgi:hypothetical protein
MPYLDDICLPLIKTLEAACFHKGARLAGLAGNFEFWVDEARNCLDAIAGYELRFERMKSACTAYEVRPGAARDEPQPLVPMSTHELQELDRRLRLAAQRFLTLCCSEGLVEFPRQREAAELLGVNAKPPPIDWP